MEVRKRASDLCWSQTMYLKGKEEGERFGVTHLVRSCKRGVRTQTPLLLLHSPRHGQPVVHNHLRICLGRFQKVAKVGVLLLELVALLLPGGNGFAVKDEHVEKSI